MAIRIPKRTSIGNKIYTIHRKAKLPKTVGGRITYRSKIVELADFDDREEMEEAFVHELVHGTLRAMGRHDLNYEKFVKAFSRRLTISLRGL